MTGPWGEPSPGRRGTGGPRALSCPSCGAPIVVRAAGASLSVICGNCGSTLDAADPDLKILRQSHRALAQPQIPLGTRGTLNGTEWEVVGYLERSGGGAKWQEYLLFNPWSGFRFLVHVDGEWRLGQALDRVPDTVPGTAMLDGQPHEGGQPYDARVTFVVGEFYWRVSVGETVEARDYIGRRANLSREANGAEVSWTRLEEIPGATIASAFGLPPPLPGETESPWPRAMLWSFVIAAAALVALVIAWAAAPSSALVAQDTLVVEAGGPAVSRILGPVEIRRRQSAIKVAATTNVDNAWVDLDYALVERRTQQRFEASDVAEYYTGTDSDGRWSEGDSRPETMFASIPRGTYDLIVEAQAQRWSRYGDAGAGPTIAVTVAVTRDAGFASNFLAALIAIAFGPLFMLWRHHAWTTRHDEDDD